MLRRPWASRPQARVGIVDATIPEPLGGAHRDPIEMASRLKAHLLDQVDRLSAMDTDTLLEALPEG